MDAAGRNALTAELSGLKLSYKVNGQIIVPFQGKTAHEVISKLQTPLKVLKIHEPSLEDAYIEFLSKSGGDAQ